MRHFDLLIIGAGAAGMAAALKADETGVSVLLVEREAETGGILRQCIHHGFGQGYFGQDMTGPEYGAAFRELLDGSGVVILTEHTVLRIEKDRRALLSGRDGELWVSFDRCILASGARERTLYSLPAGGSRPAGIFTAGEAQRMVNVSGLFIGRSVVILGSGDIGQIMARRLTMNGCEIVAMVEKEDHIGGLLRNRKECIEAYHIPVILNATIVRIQGEARINGVTIRHLKTGEEEYLACDTLLTAIGLIPDHALLHNLYDGGKLPSWLRLCGNCLKIYDIVDRLSVDAENVVMEEYGC